MNKFISFVLEGFAQPLFFYFTIFICPLFRINLSSWRFLGHFAL